MDTLFININNNDKDNSHKLIKDLYHHNFNQELYTKYNNKDLPIIYDELYNYYYKIKPDNKIISFSQDLTISIPIISALNEKYIIRDENNFNSNLKIIYIDKIPRLNLDNHNLTNNIKDYIFSSLFGLLDITICNQKLLLKPEQLYYLGLDNNLIQDEQNMLLNELDIKYFNINKNNFDLDKIKTFSRILKSIK